MQKMWVRSVLSSVLVLGALGAGCDDDERPRYSSGVDTEGPVSELDDDDLREICSSFDGYVNTYVDLDAVAYIACVPVAIVTSLNSESCEQNLHNCMALFPTPIQVSARAESDAVCFENLQQCEATVSQLEGCVNVNVDLALDIIDHLSCSRAADPNYREMVRPMADLTSVCTDVNAACNDFSNVPIDRPE